jgi:hypothetical protein
MPVAVRFMARSVSVFNFFFFFFADVVIHNL